MSVIYVVAQRLGNTLRLPLADLNNLDVPVGSYRIDGIEEVIVNPFKDETVFLPADRDLVSENENLREFVRELYEFAWYEHPSGAERCFAERLGNFGIEVKL